LYTPASLLCLYPLLILMSINCGEDYLIENPGEQIHPANKPCKVE
jgi:hypothetical protein